MTIIQAVIVAYIVSTLTATGLAKLKNFRVTSALSSELSSPAFPGSTFIDLGAVPSAVNPGLEGSRGRGDLTS